MEGGGGSPVISTSLSAAKSASGEVPFCKYVNVVLEDGMKSSNAGLGRHGVILLENPVGKSVLQMDQMKSMVNS